MIATILTLTLLLQSTPDEIPIFKLILVLAGAIFATYLCIRIGLRIMGGSLGKAQKKTILKRIVDNSKR